MIGKKKRLTIIGKVHISVTKNEKKKELFFVQ